MNLIRNALQAMDYSGSIALRSGVRDGEAFVEIEDSGHGIPDEIKERVFEPYFTTKPGGEGMGLGLDICRRIVETYRGRIEFESRPGRTVFTASFPAADATA
jgi:signal transduction histidine kinase